MQVKCAAVLCFSAILFTPLGVNGEPSAQRSVSFGLPFFTTQSGPTKYPDELCLADSVPPSENVTLISRKGVCESITQYRFRYEHPGGVEFEATVLEGDKKCLKGAAFAVVGISAEAVRMKSPKLEATGITKDTELKARRLLDPPKGAMKKSHKELGINLSSAAPEVFTVEHIRMLRFGLDDSGELKSMGPAVISVNNRLFCLEGWCTDGYLFFSVNDKLHLGYTQRCCGCGEVISYVYDLSGDTPKQVYINGKLSD